MSEIKSELAVVKKQHELTPTIWNMIKEMAPVMHMSRLFGVVSQEQAAAIMLKGYELGLPITSSFEFIQVIEGKPTLSPRGALALINSNGVLDEYKLTRLTDKAGAFLGYECTMVRGKNQFTSRFTLEDAKRAQLTEGSPTSNGKRGYGNWEKYPENMCMWRAIGFCADVVCPDITGGMTTFLKMPEQFPSVEVDDVGNFVKVVDTSFAKTEPMKIETPLSLITLNDLVAQYGPEKIMEANNGTIPGTDVEMQKVVEKLAGGK